MASIRHRRIAAMLLQDGLDSLYAQVLPLYSLSAFWSLTGIDDDLPTEGEVKTVLSGYALLEVPALNNRLALRDVEMSTAEFEGVFALPGTAFLVPFVFSGPVIALAELSQGFGVALTVQRLTVFVKDSGTAGANLSIDLKLNGVSVLSAPVSVPINSGPNVGVVIPSANVITTAIPAEGVLSAHILAAPADAQGVAVNVWVKA